MARKYFASSDAGTDDRLIQVAEQDDLAPLLWVQFLGCFDDWGRAEVLPRQIKWSLFPACNLVTLEVIERAIQLYTAVGLIELYEVGGKRYMAIEPGKWFGYQTHIRQEKRAKDDSKLPQS